MASSIPPFPRASSTASETPRVTLPNNPYKAKRLWPPNLSEMDPKHQFRLERRWRRRVKGTYMRPSWIKGVKIVQFTSILCVLGYSVAFMDWGDWNPFGEARKWLKENGAPFVGANEGGRQRGPTIHRIGEENKDRG